MSRIITPETCYPEVKNTVAQWVLAQFGPTPSYDATLRNSIDQWGLPWFRAGAVVYDCEGRILMMHEGRVQVKKVKDQRLKERLLEAGHKPGDWVDGDGGWNLPAGRLKVGESFEAAALREVKEESGWDIALQALLHTRHSEKTSNTYIMPVYLAQAISGPDQYRTAETTEIGWFTPARISDMHAAGTLRSPEFVMDSLEAYKKAAR